MTSRANKYNARKSRADGIVFDSRLEKYCYQLFKRFKIPFERQVPYVLQEGFNDPEGKRVRSIKIIIDFVVEHDGITYVIDTKGKMAQHTAIKIKMLQKKLMEEKVNYKLELPKSRKKVMALVIIMHKMINNK